MAERLDVLSLPLRGSRVIEASAGTGKTWTLAALVLRLVLGDGVARPLQPREILVMSFTKAATRELVERIRGRLADAAVAFRRPDAVQAQEPVVAALLQARPSLQQRAEAAVLLARAADAMDDAAVHTIDAWCQRVLREHAFDSGSRFDETMLADESELRREALRDWWRAEVYALDDSCFALLRAKWKDVEALEKALIPLLKVGDAAVSPLNETLADLLARHPEQLRSVKQGWVERADSMLSWLEGLWGAKKDKPIDGHKLGQANGTRWLKALRAWAEDPQAEAPDLKESNCQKLMPSGVADALKRPMDIPREFAEFEAMLAELERLPGSKASLLRHAHAAVSQRLTTLKQRAASVGFADLQRRLADALDDSLRGDAARRLREQLRVRYPVALIDECQDSSPVQMLLFERVWGLGHDEVDRTLLLIGDPKQSIYRFRGADIHGFLRARRAVGPRVHSLDTNFRSTPELVEAVNTMFLLAERREPEGAFRFGREGGAQGEPLLPFVAVTARGREDRIVQGSTALPALTLALDREVRKLGESRQRLAMACAHQVVSWLSDSQTTLHETVDGQLKARRLRPSDVAVLVRSKVEADAVRAALAQRGLLSVYLSEKDSVFAEPEAADLLRLLRAVAMPADGRQARAALASAWMGAPIAQLLDLADDDARFESEVEQLLALRQVWREQGVLAMVRQALQTLVSPARWGQAGTERMLTNTLHLAELLQAASESHAGEAALLRWLAESMDEASRGDGASEEYLLRLESDADLVQVVTVHKSKGLEYRLVCLPFATLAGGRRKPSFLITPGRGSADGHRLVQFDTDPMAVRQEQDEEARESLRLLYVALTRAEHGLWLGLAAARVGNSKQHAWHDSSLGWLIHGAAVLPEGDVAAQVEHWQRSVPHSVLGPLWPGADEGQAAPVSRWHDPSPASALRAPWPLPAHAAASWAVGSYSGFVRGLVSAPAHGWREDEVSSENEFAPADRGVVPPPAAGAAAWHRFPRGTEPGQLLHTQLEWLAGARFALGRDSALAQAFRARLERQAPAVPADDVLDWFTRVCQTPLPPLGCALAGLPRLWPELEFWLPTEQLDAARVDALCRAHVLPGQPRPPLPPRRLRGLLMGFADLVYERPDGRFGVLDHKSNALGDDDGAYSEQALAEAILSHRYDVQGALYLLALHRLLRHRLGARYRLEEHLHGAVFLFLRGIAAPGAGAWLLQPVPALIDGLDSLFNRASKEPA